MKLLVMKISAEMRNILHGNYRRLDVTEQKISKLEAQWQKFKIKHREKKTENVNKASLSQG